MELKPTEGVNHLVARRIEVLPNVDATVFGLGANPSGKWGLILAEDTNGARQTLVGAPGIIQAFLQAETLPDLGSMGGEEFRQSFPRTAKGWPVDWAREIGIKPPGENPGRVAISVQGKRTLRSWRPRNDWFKVTMMVRVQNPGAADDQTGLMTHHWMQRHEVPSFMRGVRAVERLWAK